MTNLGYILLGICLILILLPTKWDPAIRLKEWMDRINQDRK